jgi:hypothetical protein
MRLYNSPGYNSYCSIIYNQLSIENKAFLVIRYDYYRIEIYKEKSLSENAILIKVDF